VGWVVFHSFTDSSILPWLGNVVVDHHGNDEGEVMDSNGMPRSSSGNSITPVSGGGHRKEVSLICVR